MASSKENRFYGRAFALVTGASQGFGRSVAVALAAKVATGSVIAIVARNSNGLKETVELAKEARRKENLQWDIEVNCVESDLSNKKDVEHLMQSCVRDRQSSEFELALLVHNAGTIGDISKEICDFRDMDEISDYFRLNVAHIPPVTGRFVEWTATAEGKHIRTIVVNVSSMLALEPGACFSLYCSGKAARDMLFRVLAAENSKIKVLNWAPGPLFTRMSETIWSTPNRHDTDKKMRQMKDEGLYLTAEQSVKKLLELLQRDNYESGAHVDYFDV